MTQQNEDNHPGGDTGPRRSLNELAPIFNDVSTHAPYMWAEVQVTVKIFLNHPDLEEEDGVSSACTVQIEAPAPSRLLVDEDSTLIGFMEKNTTSLIIDGVETASPTISLQEVIDSFNLDMDSPIWQLGYE